MGFKSRVPNAIRYCALCGRIPELCQSHGFYYRCTSYHCQLHRYRPIDKSVELARASWNRTQKSIRGY